MWNINTILLLEMFTLGLFQSPLYTDSGIRSSGWLKYHSWPVATGPAHLVATVVVTVQSGRCSFINVLMKMSLRMIIYHKQGRSQDIITVVASSAQSYIWGGT